MIYSDTENKNGIIQRIERHTQVGDGVISGDDTTLKQVTADVNEEIYDLTTDIMLLQDSFDWDDTQKSDYPIATTPLVAGQRDYQFDAISFLKLKRVDVTYDGVLWNRAEAFDSAAFGKALGNDDTVDSNFTAEEPKIDPKTFGFWLYPRATAAQVTAGALVRIEFSRGHTEYVFDDTEKEAPIDRNFHDLIAMGAALRNPSTPADQFNKLTLQYGIQKGDGTWTGKRGQMVQHYATRNEDTFLTFKDDIRSNYK